MAHMAHQTASAGGNRRGKRGDFQSLMGWDHRRGASRPVMRSQQSGSCGLPMGALSVSSSNSFTAQSVPCNFQRCIRTVSVLAVVAGGLMLACGLFLGEDSLILGLCIPGGLLIVAVLVLWGFLYVWNGKYCMKSSEEDGGTTGTHHQHRPARGRTEEATVDLQLARLASGEVMSSYGPDTGITHHHHHHHPHRHPSHPPPSYTPIDTSNSFPAAAGGRGSEEPPSTPPPPYAEVT